MTPEQMQATIVDLETNLDEAYCRIAELENQIIDLTTSLVISDRENQSIKDELQENRLQLIVDFEQIQTMIEEKASNIEAEIEPYRLDAERYRWLRNRKPKEKIPGWIIQIGVRRPYPNNWIVKSVYGEDMDIEIDKVRGNNG